MQDRGVAEAGNTVPAGKGWDAGGGTGEDGATTMALISTTPTVCRPRTMAITSRVVNSS